MSAMTPTESAATEKRHGAELRISAMFLHELLKLPPHWKVLRVQAPTLPEYDDAITLVVTGDGLPEAVAGSLLTELIATYTRHPDGSVTVSFEPRNG